MTAELDAFRQAHPDVERVEAMLVDINGIVRGKSLPVDALGALYAGEVMLPRGAVLLDTLGHASARVPYGYPDGDPDRALLPVPGSLRPMRWARRPGAQVLTTLSGDDGTPWFANPRTVLARVLARFAERGLTPVVAVELECRLIGGTRPAGDGTPGDAPSGTPGGTSSVIAGGAAGADARRALAGPRTYDPRQLDAIEPLLDDLAAAMSAFDVELGATLSEYGPDQFEFNLPHRPDALRACDDALQLRRAVRGCARRRGLEATFAALPGPDDAGNGLHVHASVVDADGRNVFSEDGEAKGGEADDGDGLAPALRHAIGGLLESLPGSVALLAPNANAYRRLVPDGFVPTVADWGLDHRGVAVRVPRARGAGTRIEHRVAGADANPYLVVAAVLAGLLDGLERRPAPPAPTVGSVRDEAARDLPLRWHAALEALRASDVLHRALGEAFVALYLTVKEDEERTAHAAGLALDAVRYADLH